MVISLTARGLTTPLDRVDPVIFMDAIAVKSCDGQVTNQPINALIGLTVDGQRDIPGW